MKLLLKLFFLLLILAIAGAFGAVRYLESWAQSPLALKEPVVLTVQKGASFYAVARQLETMALIEDARLLRWYLRIKRENRLLQVGEYQLQPGITLQQLLDKFQRGDVIQYSVTLVNGNTFNEFVATLQAHPQLAHELKDQNPKQILEGLGSPYTHPEGLFYPDTYFFQNGDSDRDILKRAYDRMQTLLAKAWDQREENLPYQSAYEALIMASIVEKETAVSSERALIAGVFVNRLNKKMRLQTDPTVIYGLGDQYKGNITRAHLKAYTPYNTYRINGLPPTPIANPALPAIEAALHPEKTNALYFVAKGDGSHYFSETLAQHQKAVRQYQWKRRSDYRSTPK